MTLSVVIHSVVTPITIVEESDMTPLSYVWAPATLNTEEVDTTEYSTLHYITVYYTAQ